MVLIFHLQIYFIKRVNKYYWFKQNQWLQIRVNADRYLFPWPYSCFVDDIFSRYMVVHHYVRTFCHCHKVKFSLQWCIIIDKSWFRTCLVSLSQIVFSPEMHLNQVVALTTSVLRPLSLHIQSISTWKWKVQAGWSHSRIMFNQWHRAHGPHIVNQLKLQDLKVQEILRQID